MFNLPPEQMIAIVIVAFLGIGIHEYAHCKFADMAGDPTPRIYGRVTLDLTKHFELMGTLMMLFTAATGYGIGWGKPAPMDPNRMRNPRWDFFTAVAAGPVSNLVQAVIYGFLTRLLLMSGQMTRFDLLGETNSFLGAWMYFGVVLNLSLALFNLFPIGPLDGQWLLGLLMPDRLRDKWWFYNRKYGWYALIAVVIGGQLFFDGSLIGKAIRPILEPIAKILLGF